MPIQVLLVDDSAVIRGLMSKALSNDADIVIAGSAANGEMAINMARDLKPDIVILDIEMPVMDGITALPKILAASPKSKVIMASTLTLRNAAISMQALSLGASDYLAKPSAKFGNEVDEFYRELLAKVKALSGKSSVASSSASSSMGGHAIAKPQAFKTLIQTSLPISSVKAIAIACSTGGPQALINLYEALRGHLAHLPIFITQHMPPTFTTILAEHLHKAGVRPCSEAKHGDVVAPGHTYVAPGDFHMVPEKNANGQVVITLNQNPPENYCRPAADPMLRALASIYGSGLLTVVLTGMGQDGMLGAKVVVENGGNVIAQDEASSVVYGMPKAVAEQGICRAILPLGEIGAYLIAQAGGK